MSEEQEILDELLSVLDEEQPKESINAAYQEIEEEFNNCEVCKIPLSDKEAIYTQEGDKPYCDKCFPEPEEPENPEILAGDREPLTPVIEP